MYPNKSAVLLRRRDFDHPTWMREFMLEIIPSKDQLVTKGMIRPYDFIPEKLRGQTEHRYVGVDLAVSDKTSADYTSAVSLIVRDIGTKKMKIFVLPNPINERLSFNQIKDVLNEMHSDYPGTTFVIETVAAQDYVAQSVKSEGLKVVGVKPGVGKRERLNIVADKITRGIIRFSRSGCELLIAQLTGFGTEKHDDCMDAFMTAIIEICNSTKKKPAPPVFRGRRKPLGGYGRSSSILRVRTQNGTVVSFHDPHGW